VVVALSTRRPTRQRRLCWPPPAQWPEADRRPQQRPKRIGEAPHDGAGAGGTACGKPCCAERRPARRGGRGHGSAPCTRRRARTAQAPPARRATRWGMAGGAQAAGRGAQRAPLARWGAWGGTARAGRPQPRERSERGGWGGGTKRGAASTRRKRGGGEAPYHSTRVRPPVPGGNCAPPSVGARGVTVFGGRSVRAIQRFGGVRAIPHTRPSR